MTFHFLIIVCPVIMMQSVSQDQPSRTSRAWLGTFSGVDGQRDYHGVCEQRARLAKKAAINIGGATQLCRIFARCVVAQTSNAGKPPDQQRIWSMELCREGTVSVHGGFDSTPRTLALPSHSTV